MKTKVAINYYRGFDVNEFGDMLRELSDEKNRDWYYEDITFSDNGEGEGEITISYKNYPDSGFPHANVMLSEIKAINYSLMKVKGISDVR